MSSRGKLKKQLVGDTTPGESRARALATVAAHGTVSSRISLTLVGLTLVVAFLWQSAAVLWGIPAALLLLFFTKLASRDTWAAARRRRYGGPLELPDPATLSDVTAQSMVRRLRQARENLVRAMDEAPAGEAPREPYASPELLSLAGARQIERNAVVLIARLEYVSRYLSTVSLTRLDADHERLRVNERRAARPDARAVYERAASRCAAHIQSVRALEGERDRLAAMLEVLLGTLEAAPSELTRVELLRIDARNRGVLDPIEDAAHLFDGLHEIESALAPPPVEIDEDDAAARPAARA
jgi:hypothetical protein